MSIRFLFISTLFPNSINPARALYNLRHLTALRELGHSVDIIAPVPWFPGLSLLGRQYPPKQEVYEGFKVEHPRFLAPPGLFVHKHYVFYRWAVAPMLAAWNKGQRGQSTERRVGEDRVSSVVGSESCWRAGFPPEAGHQQSIQPSTINHQPCQRAMHVLLGFAYPDAVALTPVCQQLKIDYSVFVLGSDFRIRIQQPKFRPAVMRSLQQAPRIFCPGQALRNDMIAAGLDKKRIYSFNNGVEQSIFHPFNQRRDL
jgi:hypothetical protein